MKQVLHNGHLDIELTKVNARGTMSWPNINTDNENMVASHGQKWQLVCFIDLIRITLFL